MQRLLAHRFGPLALGFALVVGIATLTRIALAWKALPLLDGDLALLAPAFLVGFGYDCVAAAYLLAPFALYLALAPERWLRGRAHRVLTLAGFAVATFVLLFTAAAEWTFWDEFGTRFNFIAVDYLVYTREVVGNIVESYPIGWILAGIAAAAALIVYAMRRPLRGAATRPLAWPRRAAWALALLALPLAAIAFVTEGQKEVTGSAVANELAGNGIYEFFAAVRNNELDYAKLYARAEDERVFDDLRELLTTPDARFVSGDRFSIVRDITNPGPERRLNVVLVSVESLSAEFLGAFGDRRGLTPRLDALAQEGLVFTRLYATGTRTVRGLEALALSVPPTPGQSIVKRPGNEGLFSLAEVFNTKGYESAFVYGGYGWFDNMSAFFGANGYRVVDRTAIPAADIHHESVWGVADEDLFALAAKQMDAIHAAGRPFFLHVMTTSNHRPYTYPAARVPIPSGTSREGAVQYTDWAIGKFIDDARSKPWFADTVFVITADHTAGGAGKSDLPIARYHIPLIVYAPAHVPAGRMERLASQIDVPPTLLGLLGFSYRSAFFGYDLFRLEPGRERAFIGTYQVLGLIRDDDLAILSPGRRMRVAHVIASDERDDDDDAVEHEAIVWYEAASYAFRHGLMRVAHTRGQPAP